MVRGVMPPASEPTRSRLAGAPFRDRHIDPGKCKLTGQHQPDRAWPCNHHRMLSHSPPL
jgi:hypothetical protein